MSHPQPARTRPHLARRAGGTTVLVEGTRRRELSGSAATILEEILGAPATEAGPDGVAAPPATTHVALVAEPDPTALVAEASPGASVVIVGAVDAYEHSGRRLVALAPNRSGATGARAIDTLAIARANGATHLLVPLAQRRWLERSTDVADHLARCASLIAVSNTGALWELPAPPAPGAPKVFGIGLNKTGTTSLHLACEHLGLRSMHWGDRRAFDDVLRAQRDGRRLLEYVGEQFDAYSDIETLATRFDVADVQYPGSRFVLTVREVEGWVDSRRRHIERNRRDQAAGTYHGTNTRIDEDLWRRQWQAHLDRALAYFGDRDDLLVLDIQGGHGWERLAPFLGRPVPAGIPFPRGNVDHKARRGKGDAPPPGPPPSMTSRMASRLRVGRERVLRRLGVIGDSDS